MKGIYVFAPAGNAVRDVAAVKAGPFTDVAGFDWLCGWDKVVKSAGVYDWTVLDAARAAADSWGKQSQLCMLPGFAEPAYVLTKCPTIQIQQYNTGKFVTMCNPVDACFTTELASWIAALGAHCAGDADIASMQATGLGDQGEMVMGKLVSGVWADYGITAATLGDAWMLVIDAWAKAFPRTPRSLAIEEPLGAHQPILPGLIAWMQQQHPHMALQQNGLKASTGTGSGSYWADLHAWSTAGHPTGWQMFGYGAQNGDLATALDIGLSSGANYLQVYLQDIINPANVATLTHAAAVLAAR